MDIQKQKYRGRIFDADAKDGKGTYITVTGKSVADIINMLVNMYKNREEKKRNYQPICYIDKRDENDDFVNVMRYNAKEQKDITKIYLIIPYNKFDETLEALKSIKTEDQRTTVAKYDANTKKWYVTKDMNLSLGHLDEAIRKLLPNEYLYDYKATGYSDNDKLTVYGNTQQDTIGQLISYNKTAEPDFVKNRCYIQKLDRETNNREKSQRYIIEGDKYKEDKKDLNKSIEQNKPKDTMER